MRNKISLSSGKLQYNTVSYVIILLDKTEATFALISLNDYLR
jgi:hypothetical protein